MCGIIGITQNKESKIGKKIYEALTRLEYRGYDSVGIAVLDKESISVQKDKGAIEEVGTKLEFSQMKGSIAIGHSRWATHGPPSQINAHPHKSMHDDVAVVHNGIIENFTELRQELMDQGYVFVSQTDTELIPHFLSNELKKGKNMKEAILTLIKRIRGTYALVIISKYEPNRIYALRKDNPLIVGISENVKYCASDIPAFLPWTKDTIILRDDEMAILEPDTYQIVSLPDFEPLRRKPRRVTWSVDAAQKKGYAHHMLKEIHEQPNVFETQLATQRDIFPELAKMVQEAKKVVLVAAGTAHYASLNAYYSFPRFGGPITIPVIAAEWDSIRPIIDDETLILSVSQSGETLDTMTAIKDARSLGAKVASIVNVTGSSLTTISDRVAYIHAGPEIGVAATKTYTGQSFAVWRIAHALAQATGSLDQNEMKEFNNVINTLPKIASTIIRNNEAKARDIATWFSKKSSAFYLGRDISYVTAQEGALKMKEIAYVHAEAYPAGESKHGPIALVEQDYPVVFSIPHDHTREKMLGSVMEMDARGANTIGIIEEDDEEMKNILTQYMEIPRGYSNFLSPISYEIPQQLLAYFTSCKKGLNPDKPRNLAKAVTVL